MVTINISVYTVHIKILSLNLHLQNYVVPLLGMAGITVLTYSLIIFIFSYFTPPPHYILEANVVHFTPLH